MLRWLQKRVPNRWHLWGKLLLFVASVHCLVIIGLFFLRWSDSGDYVFTISKRLRLPEGSTIVYMPLYKQAPIPQKKRSIQSVKQPQAARPVRTKAPTALAPQLTKKAGSAHAKKATQKTTPKKRESEHKKSGVVQKKTPKHNVPEKKKQQADVQHKKSQVKKEPEKNVSTSSVDSEKKRKHDTTVTSSRTTGTAKQDQATSKDKAADDAVVVGRHEYDMMRMQAYMQQEIIQHWSPPAGVAQEAECTIQFAVDWNGVMYDSKIVHSSGVLLYDVSAHAALQEVTFPSWAQGKSFTIAFKQ